MSETYAYEPGATQAPPSELGVMGATRLGWRLLWSQFWMLWLLAFVEIVLGFAGQMVAQCFGMVPFCGMFLGMAVQLIIAVFATPVLAAGLVFAIRQKIDGDGVRIGNLFAAFRWRYWESVVSNLPTLGIWMTAWTLVAVMGFFLFFGVIIAAGRGGPDHLFDKGIGPLVSLIAIGAAGTAAILGAAMVAQLFFLFPLVALWDTPGRYWEILRVSVVLAKRHFLSVLGFVLLFGLI
jgi:hypothetical protein